ncbi:hypothetical protein SAMN05421771_2599 [Granulicella pectinivorans]|uniref:Uncharacterized protein n=1 Tax=Granulicella pectinivorans TaxID=474950 RepID=A0A1I6MGD3_9BACT|nr:hypothetical protein [Granulicella pectinivorans]SFS14795.1 hypothetical protein SAMN05421771_2599 [Granulicella pectinivorans]
MNERLVFLLSISLAEFGASAVFFLLLPQLLLTGGFQDTLVYAFAHALPALSVWAILIVLTLVLAPKLWRRRQNRTSKLSLLARIGVLGLVIDALASLYLWLRISDEGSFDKGSPIPGVLVHLGLYAVLFALIVALSDQVAAWYHRRNPPSITPPPRFGRP